MPVGDIYNIGNGPAIVLDVTNGTQYAHPLQSGDPAAVVAVPQDREPTLRATPATRRLAEEAATTGIRPSQLTAWHDRIHRAAAVPPADSPSRGASSATDTPTKESTMTNTPNNDPAEMPDTNEPCARFDWCDGHDADAHADDLAAHAGTLDAEIGVRVHYDEPTANFPHPNLYFYVKDRCDWLIHDLAQVDTYLDQIRAARQIMLDFVSEHEELLSAPEFLRMKPGLLRVKPGLLARLRETRKIPSEDAQARMIGCDRPTLRRVDAGTQPSAAFMAGVCVAFGLGIGEAFEVVDADLVTQSPAGVLTATTA